MLHTPAVLCDCVPTTVCTGTHACVPVAGLCECVHTRLFVHVCKGVHVAVLYMHNTMSMCAAFTCTLGYAVCACAPACCTAHARCACTFPYMQLCCVHTPRCLCVLNVHARGSAAYAHTISCAGMCTQLCHE